MRILIIDDERAIRSTLKGIFEDEDYLADTAEDGAIALEMVAKEHYDVIFSDIKMPNLDGTEFLAKIEEWVLTPLS